MIPEFKPGDFATCVTGSYASLITEGDTYEIERAWPASGGHQWVTLVGITGEWYSWRFDKCIPETVLVHEPTKRCGCSSIVCKHDPFGIADEVKPDTTPTTQVQQGYPDNNPKSVVGATKLSLHLVPPAATIGIATGLSDGARKYGPYNWRDNKVALSVYISALMRHLMSYWDGEELAADSGVHHLDHAIAGLAIIKDAHATGNLVDDRPRAGAASALLRQFEESKLCKSK